MFSRDCAGSDAASPGRSDKYGGGFAAKTRADCCAACESDPTCTVWVYVGTSHNVYNRTLDSRDVPGANCWPLASAGGVTKAADREMGCSSRGCDLTGPGFPDVVVTSPSGTVLWNSTAASEAVHASCNGKTSADCGLPCFWDKDSQACENLNGQANLLHWPSPLSATGSEPPARTHTQIHTHSYTPL